MLRSFAHKSRCLLEATPALSTRHVTLGRRQIAVPSSGWVRFVSSSPKATGPKHLLADACGATVESPQKARDAVERSGGAVLDAVESTVDHVECPAGGDVADFCKEVGARLNLGAGETRKFASRAKAGSGHDCIFQEHMDTKRGIMHTRLVAYALTGGGSQDSVRCTYGHFSGNLKIGGSITEGPSAAQRLVKGKRCFSVLPWTSPSDKVLGVDMVKFYDDNWFDIPSGWRPYDMCHQWLTMVRPQVIAANAWGTDMILVRQGQKWPGYKTGIRGPWGNAGKRLVSHIDWFSVTPDGRRCVFRGEDPGFTPSKKLEPKYISYTGRCLLEKIPAQEQVDAFKVYLRAVARQALLE